MPKDSVEPQTKDQSAPRRSPVGPYAGLGILVLALFAPTMAFDFAGIDDDVNVVHNPFLTSHSLFDLWRQPYSNLYIPLTYTVWRGALALPALSGLSPPVLLHGLNVLIHSGNALLVYALLRCLVADVWACVLAALLFAVHPLQVEAVAWISGLKDLLSASFSLIALLAMLRSRGRAMPRLTVLATLACIFAMLAKPGAAALPLLAIALCLSRRTRSTAREEIPWVMLLVVGSVAAALGFVTWSLQPTMMMPFQVAWYQKPLIALDALAFYARKFLLPVDLAADYGRSPDWLLAQPWCWLPALGVVAACGLCGLWRALAPYRLAASLYALALSPVLGFVPFYYQAISTTADRYAYLSLLGPSLATAIFYQRHKGRTAAVGMLIVLCALAVLSGRQCQTWRSWESVSRQILAVTPNSWFGSFNLGSALLSEGQVDEGRRYLRATVVRRPWFPDAHVNLGIAAQELGDHQEAVTAFSAALAHGDRSVQTRLYLANEQAMVGDIGHAEANFRLALQQESPSAATLAQWGRFLTRTSRHSAAVEPLRQAVARQPNVPAAQAALGEALLVTGQTEAAASAYARAEIFGDAQAETYANFGLALLRLKRYPEALQQLQEALRRSPDLPEAHHSLGLVYQVLGRLAERDAAFAAAQRLWEAKANANAGRQPDRQKP